MKIVVTGATGFVGRPLVRRLLAAGHEVRALSRDPQAAQRVLPARCRSFAWDPTAATLDERALAGTDVVVHLAGESVAGGRWSAARKHAIQASRVEGTRSLVRAIGTLPVGDRPSALVSASAIGVYGDRGDAELDETASAGTGFLATVCSEWERQAFAATESGLRVVAIRVGIVLGKGGGALAKMLPLFRLGVGGRLGSGRQWMSWIHLDDLVGLFMAAVERADVCGVVNGVAPAPVPNREFTRGLGAALGRPTLLPAPSFALRLALGEMSTLLLASQRVVPAAAERLGLPFAYPTLAVALADVCRDRETDLEYEQWVPRAPEEIFPFFSDARNLERITPAFMHFSVRAVSTPELQEGTTLDYGLRVHGVPMRWRSVIEAWRPPTRFVDRQIRGPYGLWHHTHEFESWNDGTIVRDRIRYAVPMGALGDLVAGGLVARDVATIFAFRQEKIRELFGEAPAG